MPSRGQLVSTLLGLVLAIPLAAQQPRPAPEPAQQLARDVIWNELHDRDQASRWEYLSTRTVAGQTLVREHVETSEGPISLDLEHNGAPLDAAQQQRESRRIAAYIHNPAAIGRRRRSRRQDEARLASIMQIIPQAFLFEYQGAPSGDVVSLAFHPDPAFVPSGYDARIIHALSGTMTVNLRQKRMIDMRGVISQPVDIGYGLLGSVNPGSTFEIHRSQVSPAHWKTDLLDVHVHGRLLMLKSISKDQREERSEFHPVPEKITLVQADVLLRQAAANRAVQAQLGAAAGLQPSSVPNGGVSSDP